MLELELTSNRPDCFSIYGIAREVAAAARLELAPPPIAAPAAFGGAPGGRGDRGRDRRPRPLPAVRRHASSAASRIGESPAWLKARLTHAGMRPINNVVDVTNYVMLGWGQPLHAFDAGKIRGGKLIARRAAAGEKIVTLDGVERTLDDQMLVIADVERALVIAGVFGSVDAEIDEHTTDIVLEAANFAGPSILRTELHTGIRSEASNRFEKGIDPDLVPGGLDFADRLFAELCGGTVAPGMVDAGGVPPAPAPLSLPAGAGRRRCSATPCPAAEQAGILRRLECEVDEAARPATAWSGRCRRTFRPDLDPRGRPHRGGRAHRRLRPGARDAAAAPHRRRADPGRSRCGAPCGAPWPAAAWTRSSPTRSSPPTPSRRSGCPRATSASSRSGSPTR